MKRIFAVMLCLSVMCGASWGEVEINATNFPDDAFRSYISSRFDTDRDSVLSDAEITGITYIEVNRKGISSLKGVEYFTALTELRCGYNQLTELDVSNNTALTRLLCDGNQLTALNVNNNTVLTELTCWDNQLTELDVSNNTALTKLTCYENHLTKLDVSNNTALTELSCWSNQLATLDLSNNTALTTLSCYTQEVSPLNITSSGRSSYPYQLNFNAYMSPDKFANVSGVVGLKSSDASIATIYSEGIAQFASAPSKVMYGYATGYTGYTDSGVMYVTISDTANLPDTPSPPNTPGTPASSSISSHKYHVFNLGMTWDEAKAYCENLGGHLATITSQEEYDAVMSAIAQDEAHIYWLGADKTAGSDEWRWVTGEPFTFTKWHSGEPNNQGNMEQCLELTNYWPEYNGQWGWNDEIGSLIVDGVTGFICEWEPVEANFAPLNPEYLKWRENPSAYFEGEEFYGELPDPFDTSHLADNPVESSGFSYAFHAADTLPSRYDPRTTGKVSAVRDQLPYGTCWSFASLGAMETNYLAQNLGTVAPDLSELHQAWFAYKDSRPGYAFELNYEGRGILDQGGSLTMSMAFLSRAGTASETELPYSEAQNVERNTAGKLPENYSNPLRLRDVYIVGNITANNRDEVKRLIMKHGALRVSFTYDRKGFSRNDNTYYYDGEGTGHAVALVGWDDSVETGGGKGAWLVRNSWGSSWGEGGYFWMSYAQNISNAAVFIADDKTQGLRSKGYDQLGYSDTINWHWSANVFRAEGNETIREVAFHTSDNNVSYEIYINKLGRTQPVNPGVPDKSALSGTMPYAGYHSVSLNGTIDVEDGEYFSVIVKLTGLSKYEYYSAVEEPGTFTAAAVHIGESYFAAANGTPALSDWKDGTTVMEGSSSRPCNACIKVLTADKGSTPTPTPDIPTPQSSGGGGGGCDASSLQAILGTLALVIAFARKK